MRHKELSIDFETASLADLRRTGVYPYACHESTLVLCMSYAFDDGAVKSWSLNTAFPADVLDHVRRGGRVNAWNANFEFYIWNNTLIRQCGLDPDTDILSISQLHDTMAAGAYWGLPLSLDQAAPAAGLSVVKDKDGHRLMMQMCKPRKYDPEQGILTWWHEDDPAKFARLREYCDNDVATERAIRAAVPNLPEKERAVWMLDQRINHRGVTVDYDLVGRLKELSLDAADRAADDMNHLTGGAVKSINSHGSLLAWLREQGYPEDNLRRGTVEKRLEDPDCLGLERAGLELRSDAARTSAAKLNAMLDAKGPDGNVRGMLQYYGANRTGRWAGRLIQLQNMPRGVISNIDDAIKLIANGGGLDMIEALHGPAMGVISSCLRGCIVAPEGKELAVADFSQIEARVLPWLAGQQDVLDVFRKGEDVYVQAAAGIYGVPAAAVDKAQRQIGKVAILALGYGGGKGAFKTMASAYGLEVEDEKAEEIKAAWRQANQETVKFWWALDAAARAVLRDPTAQEQVGPLKLGRWGPHMVIVLPSMRALVYRDVALLANEEGRGDDITYMGINQYTRKWERVRTYGGKLAENVTQAVARDVMADAMLRADERGHEIILTVHDELLTVADAGYEQAKLDDLIAIMRKPPVWARDLPTDADGWAGGRYRK